MRAVLYSLLYLVLVIHSSHFHPISAKSVHNYLIRQSNTQFPPFDDLPTIPDGHSTFSLPIETKSEMLGLSTDLVGGIKLFMSDQFSIPVERWVYRAADVIDAEKFVFFIRFQIIVPDANLKSIEAEIRQFVNDGSLASSFSALGVDGLVFSVQGADSEVNNVGNVSQPNATSNSSANVSTNTEGPTENVDNTNSDPQNENQNVEKELVLDVIPDLEIDQEQSQPLPLYILSPQLFFPDLLRQAIVSFLADASDTSTEPPSWYMNDIKVLNESLGQYIGSFVHVGSVGTTNSTISSAKQFVDAGGLTKALAESSASSIQVKLLPKVQVSKTEQPPTPSESVQQVDVFVRISAPISGIPQNMSQIFQKEASKVTATKSSSWRLTSLRRKDVEVTNGPWVVTFSLLAENSNRVVADMTQWVRSRAADHLLWELGWTDARVRALPRMTKFKSGAGSQGGVVTATAATVTASVAGVVLVAAIGLWISCLLPRGNETNENRENRRRFRLFSKQT